MPDTSTRMTTADVALMREIVRWRKSHGIELSTLHGCYQEPTKWGGIWGREQGHAVTWSTDPHDGAPLGFSKGGSTVHDWRWSEVESFGQAVDLLVAYGFLPPRFSSAYRAGWHAAEVWNDDDCDREELKRLFHDPENISFPAVPE